MIPGAPPLPHGTDEHTVFRALFSAYPDALLLVDGAGRIVLANPAAATLLGYALDELVGLDIEALVPDAIRPRHAAFREAYGRAPRARPMGTQMDLVARRRDGSEVMVEIALSPLLEQGLPFVVAAIRGIGAYPRVRQALQRARYSEHLAQFGRQVVDARDPGRLLREAPALAVEALQMEAAVLARLEPGRREARIVGAAGALRADETPGSLVPPGSGTLLARALATEGPVADEAEAEADVDNVPGIAAHAGSAAEFAAQAHAETGPAARAEAAEQSAAHAPAAAASASPQRRSSLAVPLAGRGRNLGALVVHAATPARFGEDERRFLESLASLLATGLQRAESEEALSHSQRLESVGQLTGGIAHDFNNLLTVIQGNLQVLEEQPALAGDDYGQQLVAAATRASRRAAELTGKLLAFSRRQVLQPRALDLQALLDSLADMLRRTLDQRIRIELDVAPGCPAVLADPGQLESALLNIAINARDAMPAGGVLRFGAAPATTLDPELSRDLVGDAAALLPRHVAITIADSGEGMSEEVRERAFEPFYTTKSAGRGTGLGLSTVYGFVKQSHGAITIDSAPGAGTTVTLYLPVPAGEAPAAVVEAEGGRVPPGLAVLLVEDDAEVRQVVETFLHALGCRVTTAASGEQALLTLGPEARHDLLLSDIALGAGLRGTELAAEAQARHPRLAVLLMSGYSAELLEADSTAPPDWELLRKPYSRAELAQAIGRLFDGREAGGGERPTG